MNENLGANYGSPYTPSGGEGEKPSSHKISFDDFEIEREAAEEEERSHKRGVPRIKTLRDDLLGGGKKLSSKLFGVADDGALAQRAIEPQNVDDGYEPISTKPADLPYFSDEELANVRIRKIPKSASQGPHIQQTAIGEEQNIEEEEEPAVAASIFDDANEVIENNVNSVINDEPSGITFAEEEDTLSFIQEEVEVERIAPVEPIEEQEVEIMDEYIDDIPHEPQVDPALRVYLDTIRGFSGKPRRATDLRDPRKDFVLLLSELLDLVREQTGAMSALFFWTNPRKEQLVLECASLDDFAHSHISNERRFPVEHDAISRVFTDKTPQLLQSIAPQAEYDLIPYYRDTIGVRSLAALPVFFGDAIVAVLAVDSLEEEQFTPETLRIMTNYSKVISGLVRSYIEAYDLLNSARTLKAARKLFQIAGADISRSSARDAERTSEYIMRQLTEGASDLVEWQWLSTIAFDDALRAWSISGLQAKSADPYVLPKTKIDLGESLVGKVLRTGKSENIEALNQQSVRFSIDEERQRAVGHSFLVIPIRTNQKNYGALVLEHSEQGKYTDVDVETLEHLARSAATSLEIFALSELVADRALTDILTATLNKRGFKERFTDELARAKEFDEPLSVILFEIDDASKFEERFLQEDIDTVILALSNVLQFIKQPYDVLARIGEYTFAVLLVKMTDEDAFLWSEKVRQKIVSEVIALSRKSFTITTSIGVAGARRNSTSDELLICARMALDKAKERGGNEVIVY